MGDWNCQAHKNKAFIHICTFQLQLLTSIFIELPNLDPFVDFVCDKMIIYCSVIALNNGNDKPQQV